MTGAVTAEELRLSEPVGHPTTGTEGAPSDRVIGLALRALATLGLLPLLLLMMVVTGVAIPLCRLVAACEGVVRAGARSTPGSGRIPTPGGFGPRR
jgi:hypothetical protein